MLDFRFRSDFKDVSITRAPPQASKSDGMTSNSDSVNNAPLGNSFPTQTKAFKVDSDDDLDLDLRIPRLLPDEFYTEDEKRSLNQSHHSVSRSGTENEFGGSSGAKKTNASLHPKTAREER